MVSILPSARSPFDVIGADVGRALQGVLPGAVEKGYNRGMLQKSLEDIKNLPQKENASALDVLTSMMQAGAGIPGSERYMAQLYPLVLQQMQGKMAKDLPQPGMGQPPSQQLPSLEGATSSQFGADQQQQNLPIALPEPAFEPYKNELEGIDLGVGPVPKTYSPEQYREVNEKYLASGMDPAPAIESMKLQDAVARQKLDDAIKATQTVGNIADLRAQQQERIRAKLRSHMPELSESDFAVAERIAQRPEFRDIKNDNLRAQKVKQEYDLYQKAANNFSKVSERSNFNDAEYNRQIRNLGSDAKIMVRNGQRDLASQILSNNGWGPVEVSKILNPLDEQTTKSIQRMPNLKNPLDNVTVTSDDPRFENQADRAIKNRAELVNKYKTVIEDGFKTGSYDPSSNIQPGTSLLQLRDEFMQKGGEWQEFEELVNNLVNSGKIKLDSYQQDEKTLLGQHPDKSFSIGEIIWRLNPLYKGRK